MRAGLQHRTASAQGQRYARADWHVIKASRPPLRTHRCALFGAGGSSSSGPLRSLQQQQQQQQQEQPPPGLPPADPAREAADERLADSAAAADAAPAPPPGPGDEWASWCSLLGELRVKGAELDQLNSRLSLAAQEERYADAAELSREAASLAAGDALAALRRALRSALEAEDYSAAAALRDAGHAWLEGWWWGSSHDDASGERNAEGHLLRVTSEYGRWTGRVYSTRDITGALGWHTVAGGAAGGGAGIIKWRGGDGSTGVATRVAPPSGGGELDGAALFGAGAPLLEVLLRDAGCGDDGADALRSQAIYLWPRAGAAAAAPPLSAAAAGAKAAGGGAAAPAGGASVKAVLTVSIDADGVATVSAAQIPEDDRVRLDKMVEAKQAAQQQQTDKEAAEARRRWEREQLQRMQQQDELRQQKKQLEGLRLSKFESDWEIDEVEATLRALRGEEDGGGSASDDEKIGADADASRSPDGALATKEQEDEDGDEDGSASDDESVGAAADASRAAAPAAAAAPAPAAAPPASASPQPAAAPRTPPPASASSRAGRSGTLRRLPAELVPFGLNRFVLSPRYTELDEAAAPVPAAASVPPSPPAATAPSGLPPAAGPARAAAAGPVVGGSGAEGAAGEDQLWSRVADEVAKVQEERSGVPVQRAELAEAIRTAARRLIREGRLPQDAVDRIRIITSGGAVAAAPGGVGAPLAPQQQQQQQSSRSPESRVIRAAPSAPQAAGASTSPPSAAAAAAASAAAPPTPPSIAYTRLPGEVFSPPPHAAPFEGLFVGAFGAHGPEVVQMGVELDEDGEEVVVGRKITGDDNVPCGEVSFRARVGRQNRLDPRGHYPDELGVEARYPGQGCVADPGFSDPKWVDGELLLFSQAANPLVTGGARAGFVWRVPGETHFLIMLNRIRLPA